MKLTGADNKSFELWVLGYQFPDIHHDEYDSNWLRVGIKVEGYKKPWITSDPSLLTWELNALKNWLESLGKNGTDKSVDFIEPNLGFELVHKSDTALIRINLQLESKPSWFNEHDVFSMEILADPKQISESIDRLSLDLKKFPPRAGIHF